MCVCTDPQTRRHKKYPSHSILLRPPLTHPPVTPALAAVFAKVIVRLKTPEARCGRPAWRIVQGRCEGCVMVAFRDDLAAINWFLVAPTALRERSRRAYIAAPRGVLASYSFLVCCGSNHAKT